ncbi:purine nucleoside permease [Granulicella sibirica]|uniref:Purine nucleoside permease n=1 Tax=Granulicella sibirica TaxID=2479048 RepID=A0A4Q0SZX7_9BACT|nr:purine nucleoside permease [Granulicella sibirica]RXH55208.1 Purine nucleoside permease [Granulicella sibirica]
MTRRPSAVLATLLLLLLAPFTLAQQKPWPIRAVIIATFEIGADTGDIPGEFQLWAEREHLDEVIEFPGGIHPLRTNADHTILGMVSGTTLVNSTASMMALGLDPRFDLTHAYILINGIAGVDPNDASIGSAAWARYVVGDVAREIDPREAPATWPYGIFPVEAHEPRPESIKRAQWFQGNSYPLNAKLAEWAYAKTKSLKLGDDPVVAKFREGFTGFPNAQKPPFVLLGDTFASDYYWHGKIMTEYANDWVSLYTEKKGNFVMTEMEDSGFMNAIGRLAPMHKVDPARVMVLRTGSNYSMPRPGHTAVESVTAPYIGSKLALESAWLCGSTVLRDILSHWDTTYAHVPGD